MTVREWLELTDQKSNAYLVRPRAVCNDGVRLSIQCSSFHYRRVTSSGIVLSVEVQAPDVEELKPFIDEEDADICAYLDIDLLEHIVAKHGGIVGASKET